MDILYLEAPRAACYYKISENKTCRSKTLADMAVLRPPKIPATRPLDPVADNASDHKMEFRTA